jgi:hypothetical protein
MQRPPPFAVIETHMHILLVEDDDSLATAIRRIFTAEGHVVDCVADGLEGLTQAGFRRWMVLKSRGGSGETGCAHPSCCSRRGMPSGTG